MNKKNLCVTALLLSASLVSIFAHAEVSEPLVAGNGKVRFGALLQSWGVNDTTASAAKFNLRIRRAEIKFSGSVAEGSRWFLMVDAAKNLSSGAVSPNNDNKVLQDLGVVFSISKTVEVVFGQFKIPTTAEGLDSAGELILPERSLVGRGVSSERVWGDRREPGFMLTYTENMWKTWLAMTNGQRTNVDDVTNSKDLHFRLEVSPVDAVKVGAFTTAGDSSYSSRGRWGLNSRFKYDDLQIRVEAVHANDDGMKSNGWDADAAYLLTPEFQPVVRYEVIRNGVFQGTTATFGMNYFHAKHGAKIQVAYSRLSDISGSNGTYQLSEGKQGSLAILSFQAAL